MRNVSHCRTGSLQRGVVEERGYCVPHIAADCAMLATSRLARPRDALVESCSE